MKNKKKILLAFSFCTLLPSVTSLFSCDNTDNKEKSSLNYQNITIQNPFKSVYGIGVIIDFGNIDFIINENGSTITLNGLDNRLNITGGDTDTLGIHQIEVTYKEKTFTFKYEVKQFYLTLDFNSGTYNEKSSVKLPLFNDRVNIEEYIPTSLEGEKEKSFAGWYYDKECEERALFANEKEFRCSEDVTLFAGYDLYYDDRFVYTIDEKTNTVTLVSLNFDEAGFDICLEPYLTIPSTIKGYPVVEVGKNFFINTYYDADGNLIEDDYAQFMFTEEIIFPEDSHLERIGDNAFANLINLKAITFPESLQSIGNEAFLATNLSGELHFNKNLTKIGSRAFATNSALEKISFEEGSKIRIIGEEAFLYDNGIYSAEFPEGLEEIRDAAFSGCSGIDSLTLPSSISIIGSGAFKNMSSLEEINVAEDNKNYSSLNGNLYSKDMKKLIRYCHKNSETTFYTPSSLTSIGDLAFAVSGYSSLDKLVLNKGLISLGKEVFANCTFNVTLPSSVSGFSVETFNGYLGKKIDVDSDNEKYISQDGILYSRDFSILYACPDFYQASFFTLDDRVQTISRNAFYGSNEISAFTIGRNSSLKEVQKDGLNLASMTSLKYLDIQNMENVKFLANSLSSKEVFSNNNFIVVLANKEDKTKFLSQLSDSDSFKDRIYAKEEVENATISSVKTNFEADYGSFETSYRNILKLPNVLEDEIKTSLSLTAYSLNNDLYNDKEYLYYSSYCDMIYFSIYANIYLTDNFSVVNNGYVLSYLNGFYKVLPETIQNEVSTFLNKANNEYVYLNDEEGLAKLYRDILSFDATSTSFDRDAFMTLKTRAESLQMENVAIPDLVYQKYILLEIDNDIANLLDIDLDKCDNAKIDEIYQIIESCPENNWYSLSSKLEQHYSKENRQKKVYRYDEYVSFEERFEEKLLEIEANTIEAIKNFDLTTFDYDNYLDFYNNNIFFIFDRFIVDYYLSEEIQTKDDQIISALYISKLHQFDDSLTDYNFANAYYFADIIDKRLQNLSDDEKTCIYDYSYYLDMKEEIAEYAKNYAETFADIINSFELTEENLDEENVQFFLDTYSCFIANVDNSQNDVSSIFLEPEIVAKYNAIMASCYIKCLLKDFPSLNKENLHRFKMAYEGYYSIDELEFHEGCITYLELYISNTDTSSILNYDKYQELIGTLSNLENA